MTRTRLAVAAAAIAVVSLVTTAHAQTWRPVARRCAEEMGRTAAAWPLWVQCTVSKAFPNVSRARTQQCIRRVEEVRMRERECDACGDPVGDVVSCVER